MQITCLVFGIEQRRFVALSSPAAPLKATLSRDLSKGEAEDSERAPAAALCPARMGSD